MLLRGVPCLRRVVTSYVFELIFVSLILLNCISMMVQIEFFGLFLATSMGIKTGMDTDYNDVFYNIELVFGLVFSAEILVKFVGFLEIWLELAGPVYCKFPSSVTTVSERTLGIHVCLWMVHELGAVQKHMQVLTWAIDAGGLAVEINPMVFPTKWLRIGVSWNPRVRSESRRIHRGSACCGSLAASFQPVLWEEVSRRCRIAKLGRIVSLLE